jgi:protein-S-isoprenylcysteine O-methyltransferase Ste14
MFTASFFNWFLLGALGCFAGLATGRALVMQWRGVRVKAQTGKQPVRQRLENILCTGVATVRPYETIAYIWPLKFHLFPTAFGFGLVLMDFLPLKILGALLWTVALVIYALAIWTMGRSWRIGIESRPACSLVTHGIFACSRNPIFLGFGCMAAGTFLILGRVIFLLLALLSIWLIHSQILREEKFLAEAHGENYRAYRTRTGRYLKWF